MSDTRTDRPPVTVEQAQRAIAEAARSVTGVADPTLVTSQVASLPPFRPERSWEIAAEKIGIPAEEVLKMSANENALGPSQKAVEAAQRALTKAHRYPDSSATQLREALAEHHDVSAEHVFVGNGTGEIIDLLVRTFVGPGETVVTAWPAFVVYRLAAQAAGREALIAPLHDDRYDLAAMAALVDRRTKLVFISNPNNPTGTYVPRRVLAAFLDRIPSSVIVVLDEAYHEYVTAEDYPDGIRDFRMRQRLVVLRTFSKIYGLAGLRIGYGVMDRSLREYLDRMRQPHNVSSIAQAAALAALSDEEHVRASRRVVGEGRAALLASLREIGLEPIPSQTNFIAVRLPVAGESVVSEMRKKGVLVQSLRAYDLPNAIRITVGTKEMNLRVQRMLQEMQANEVSSIS